MQIRPTHLLLCRLALAASLALGGAAAARAAAAAADMARLGDYRHDIWSARDGAPGDIDSMAQDRDGWLWLGTSAGLFRYDGVRFSRYEAGAGALLSPAISHLQALPNGDLWIGYTFGTGVSRLRQGRLTHFAATPGLPISTTFSIAVDADASVWIATLEGLLHYDGTRWRRIGAAQGLPGNAAFEVLFDRHGELWASTEDALYRRARGSARFVAANAPGRTSRLLAAPDGQLWQVLDDRLRRVPAPPRAARRDRDPDPAQEHHPDQDQEHDHDHDHRGSHANSHGALFDRDGNLWSKLRPSGLRLTAAARLRTVAQVDAASPGGERLDQPWQMSSLEVRSLLEDREGNVWVGTRAGLERFRRYNLQAVPYPLGVKFVSLARARDGRLHAVSVKDRRWWQVTEGAAAYAPGRAAPSGWQAASPRQGWSLVAAGADGAVLLADASGIERHQGGSVTRYALPAAMRGHAENRVTNMVDDGHSLWVSFRNRAVYRRVGGAWVAATDYAIPALVEYLAAGRDGQLWCAYADDHLSAYADGTLRHYGRAQGLDLGNVRFIDASHEVLAASATGLAVLQHGRFRRIASDPPALLHNVSGLLVTADGDRWFNAPQGIVHVDAAAWRAAMAQPEQPLRHELLGTADGYPGVNQTALRSPSAAFGRDGQLWFVASGGLVMLAPARLRHNDVAPPLALLSVNGVDVRYRGAATATAPLRLPNDTRELSIAFTALSLSVPEQVRFRYRLVGAGADAGWRDSGAGAPRHAVYRNLGAGRYRFEVIAANEDGLWNSNGAHLDLYLPASLWRSGWVLGLAAALAAVLLYGVYGLRLRQVTRRMRERMLVRQGERERIARSMHDTLLQGMQALILRLQVVSDRLHGHAEARQMLERVLDHADLALLEGRSHVLDLRSASEVAIGLDHALRAAAATAAAMTRSDTAFTLACSGAAAPLDGMVGEEIFNVGREALVNAFHHAAASAIAVHLHYGAGQVELRIADDGKGIAADVLALGLRPGHWGLTGMRERSEKMGAQLRIDSALGQGTVVHLRVPAALAYQAPRRQRLWQRLRRALRRRAAIHTYG